MNKLLLELKKFFSVPKNLVFMIAGPLALTLLFGYVYSGDYLNDIPIAVFDMDGSSLSRNIVQTLSDDQRYVVEYYASDLDEIRNLVETKQVYMGVIIPEDLEKDVKIKKATNVALVIDGTNIAISNNALASASEILSTINAGITIQSLEGKGVPAELSENYAKLFQFNNRILWDPKLSYKYYVMPGMVLVLIQQLFLSVFVINAIKDKENMVLKAAIHIAVGILSYAICANIMAHVLNIQIKGNIGIASLVVGLYLMCLTGTAILISGIAKTELKATQFCMMMSLPTFLTAGYVWPMFKMPSVLVGFIKLIWPLIYMVAPLRDYLIKGQFPATFGTTLMEICLFGGFWLVVAYFLVVKKNKRIVSEEEESFV